MTDALHEQLGAVFRYRYSPQTLFLTLFEGKRPLRTPPDPSRPIYPVPEAHMVAQVSAQSTKPTNPDS